MEYRILELFSGIGGMHQAFELSGIRGKIVAAIDINLIANTVYAHNYPDVWLLCKNIQKITSNLLERIGANAILMSPPCQPFTRNGKQLDIEDTRCDALRFICEALPLMESIECILLENVVGFEQSKSRDLYIDTLTACKFDWREYILSPSQLEVPNTRRRYYCLARKFNTFPAENVGLNNCIRQFPGFTQYQPVVKMHVKDIIESNVEFERYALPDDVLLKRIGVLDITFPYSENTMCFTKSYTHYAEGTGSVYCPYDRAMVDDILERSKQLTDQPEAALELLKTLKLRYFTPIEVARLMSFDTNKFSFPDIIKDRQKYRLLGNSINVRVVSILIKYLCEI